MTDYLGSGWHEHVRMGIGGKGIVKSVTEIPIVDLKNMRSPRIEERRAVAKEICDACAKVGFLYIKNHGVPQELVDEAFVEARRFFHELSEDQKMEIINTKNPNFYGYAPIRTNPVRSARHMKHLFESVNFGYEPQFDDAAVGTEDNGESFWPKEEDLPDFKKNLGKYYSSVIDLSRNLLRMFALGLDLDEDFFNQFYKRPATLLKMNHYPKSIPISGGDAKEAGIEAHTDLQGFTILAQEDVKSLEVLLKDGQWVDAEPVRGTFVVNIGDSIAMWTNDILKSTLHRVVNREGKARYSIPFCFGPDFDAVMETLPSCITADRPAKYKTITAGEYHRMRLNLIYPKDD